jgi:hypothetical protein
MTTTTETPAGGCEICASEREDCGYCDGTGEDGYSTCLGCGGTGEIVPAHCCACGGGEYDCICCPHCGAQNVGKCACTLTVQTHDGSTLELEG